MAFRICPDDEEQRICECSDMEMQLYCLPALIDEILEMLGWQDAPDKVDRMCLFLINERLRNCWKTWPTFEAFEADWNEK